MKRLLPLILLVGCASTPTPELTGYDALDLNVVVKLPPHAKTVGAAADWFLEVTDATPTPYTIDSRTRSDVLARSISPLANGGGEMSIRQALSAVAGEDITVHARDGQVWLRTRAEQASKARQVAVQ